MSLQNSPRKENIIQAVKSGNLDIIVKALADKIDISQWKNENGSNLLFVACENQQLEIAELILSYCPMLVNELNAFGVSCLMRSCDLGNINLVSMLTKKGKADILAIDSNGWNCFLFAARNGNTDTIRTLLEFSPNLIYSKSIAGQMCIHISSHHNKFDAVKFALDNGMSPNLVDNAGQTPLILASYNGNEDVVKLLLKYRADPTILDYQGGSALTYAADFAKHFNHYGIVNALKSALDFHKSQSEITPNYVLNDNANYNKERVSSSSCIIS